MTSRPSLLRSIPFWILVIGSVASLGLGAWIVVSKLDTMIKGLTAQTATTADVYGGQSWVVFGAALVGAGLIGLALALAVAAIGTFLRRPEPVEAVETIAIVDDAAFSDDIVDAPAPTSVPATPEAAAEAAPADAPAAEASAVEDVSDEDVPSTTR